MMGIVKKAKYKYIFILGIVRRIAILNNIIMKKYE